MKLINKTHYDTKALKALMQACVEEVRKHEGTKYLKNQTIYVRYGRKAWFVGGYAYYNSTTIVMKPPKTWRPDPGRDSFHQDFSWKFADTFIHELGHNLGFKHKSGPGHYRSTIEHRYQDWLKENVNSEKFPLTVKTNEKTPAIVKIQTRYKKALAAQTKAERRFKLAKTLLKKWSAKVKYYERSYAYGELTSSK